MVVAGPPAGSSASPPAFAPRSRAGAVCSHQGINSGCASCHDGVHASGMPPTHIPTGAPATLPAWNTRTSYPSCRSARASASRTRGWSSTIKTSTRRCTGRGDRHRRDGCSNIVRFHYPAVAVDQPIDLRQETRSDPGARMARIAGAAVIDSHRPTAARGASAPAAPHSAWRGRARRGAAIANGRARRRALPFPADAPSDR